MKKGLCDEKNICIDNIKDFIESLQLSNIHEEFYVFCYLLWNGYFSIDNKFSYGRSGITDDNKEYSVFLGMSTSYGASSLLTDVFKEKCIYAKTIGVSIKKIKLDNIMNIKRNFSDKLKDFSKCKSSINQMVTSTSGIGVFSKNIIFDPILLTECEILDTGEFACINGKYKIDKGYMKGILRRPFFYSYELPKKTTLDSKEIINSYDNMNRFCTSNRQLFNDLYDANKEHYEKIKTLL